MNTFTIIRSIYRRLRSVPVLGTLAEAIRYRRVPTFSTATKRYAEQQALIDAHGYALAGLRQAATRSQAKLEVVQQAINAQLQERLQAFHQINDAELHKQIHHLNQRFDEQQRNLEQRLEFQRQEALFELRYSRPEPSASALTEGGKQPTVRILNTEKLLQQQANGAIRLNVGCGHKPESGRLNVDMRELPGVDIIATVDQLPFGRGEVQEIYCAHLLEHFPQEQLRRSLLPAWVALLCAKGELRAVVPDIEAMLKAYEKSEIDFATLRLVTFGGQEYEGDFHHTMFTPESLVELFTEQGLVDVRVEVRDRRNGLCLECVVVGTKA